MTDSRTFRCRHAARNETLVSGKMFLQPDDGSLVPLEGMLAKNALVPDPESGRSVLAPTRVSRGLVVPVSLESNAHVLGPATLASPVSTAYSHIDGRHRRFDSIP
jgi:hypothetical protein